MASLGTASPVAQGHLGGRSHHGVNKTTSRVRRTQACQTCHARKVKCSGGQPCQNCSTASTCVYAEKTRRVKVTEKYLEEILAENNRLKQNTSISKGTQSPTIPPEPASRDAGLASSDATLSNPVMTENAWFIVTDSEKIPNYIPDAACPAFATRFRQTIAPSGQTLHHYPRTHWVADEHLKNSNLTQGVWPSRIDAQLLVKVAVARVNGSYHVLLPKATMALLDQAYSEGEPLHEKNICKLFALFALGRAYSSHVKQSSAEQFPGLEYFKYASSLVNVLPERPHVEHVESLILLSFYQHNLNRRNSAYSMIGSAMRLAILLGLHHNLPSYIKIDPILKQHRNCLWYTVYTCDRMWASKVGYPLGTQDADFSVDLPTLEDIPVEQRSELPDPGSVRACVRLASIAGDVINTIYCRSNPSPFLQSVQTVLRALQSWYAELSPDLKLAKDGNPTARYIISLHLHFNHILILATRPVLLHVLDKRYMEAAVADHPDASSLNSVITTLKEASIQSARHSIELLTQAWVDGSLALIGHFDAQCLFSSAMVLAISTVLSQSKSDTDRLDSACELLDLMAKSGNLSGLEFSGHMQRIKQDCEAYKQNRGTTGGPRLASNDVPTPLSTHSRAEVTTEMVLGQTTMQDFLTQVDFAFDIPNFDADHLFLDWTLQNPIGL